MLHRGGIALRWTQASAVAMRRIQDGEIAHHIDSIIVTIIVCFVSK